LLPRHVGIVTSPTGAAIRDILNIITRRFPNLHVVLAPVRVQGAGAAEEIAAAIDHLNALSARATAGEAGGRRGGAPLDVLIVGRGGGSLEDLWCFNEECVARAIARSDLPVISAVGHEIDFTISDFVADVRAPTPSAAAELVVGRKEDFEASLRNQTRHLRQALRQRLTELRGRLETARASHVFHAPRHAVERTAQALDALELRLKQALSGSAVRQHRRLEEIQRRIARAVPVALERRQQHVAALERQLRALSPVAVLERGYSLTRTVDGKLVKSVQQVSDGARLRTQVADGTFESIVKEVRVQAGILPEPRRLRSALPSSQRKQPWPKKRKPK